MKYPPREGYTVLTDSGAIITGVKRKTPRGKEWLGYNPHCDKLHHFTTDVVIFAAHPSLWDVALAAFKQESVLAQQLIKKGRLEA